jgi:hypothetical protein
MEDTEAFCELFWAFERIQISQEEQRKRSVEEDENSCSGSLYNFLSQCQFKLLLIYYKE